MQGPGKVMFGPTRWKLLPLSGLEATRLSARSARKAPPVQRSRYCALRRRRLAQTIRRVLSSRGAFEGRNLQGKVCRRYDRAHPLDWRVSAFSENTGEFLSSLPIVMTSPEGLRYSASIVRYSSHPGNSSVARLHLSHWRCRIHAPRR